MNRPLRLVSYNVHSCRGADGVVSAERVADVVASLAPDVVALQELDSGRQRSGGERQPDAIARRLRMEFFFCCTVREGDEAYGHAIMSHHPMSLVHVAPLPSLHVLGVHEPRSAMWTRVEVDGSPLDVVSTHLGLSRAERSLQVDALLGSEWLGHPELQGPHVLCGDLNTVSLSRTYRRLRGRMSDARLGAAPRAPRASSSGRVLGGIGARCATFPARFPLVRIDYVFVSEHLRVVSFDVPRTPLTRKASDHLPVVAELALPSRTRT
jgi:endonuclease/exonuclease/phosphatase family metal-dependent hydrolase